MSRHGSGGQERVVVVVVAGSVDRKPHYQGAGCTLPAETGQPLSRWSSADLAGEAITRGLAEAISPATVRRWLAADAIKPWQHRSWIFPRTRISRPRPPGCSTCTPAAGRASRWAPTTTCSAPTRNPSCRPCTAATGDRPPATRANPTGRVRLPARRHPGLPRRLRRAPRPGARPDRPHHRHRAVHRPGRPGDDHRALRLGPAGCSGSSTTARRTTGRRSIERMQHSMADRDPGAHTGARLLAEPGRDLLLDTAAQSITPNDFADLDQLSERSRPSRTATTRPPHRSTGTYTRDDLNAPPPPRPPRHTPYPSTCRTTPDELTAVATSFDRCVRRTGRVRLILGGGSGV